MSSDHTGFGDSAVAHLCPPIPYSLPDKTPLPYAQFASAWQQQDGELAAPNQRALSYSLYLGVMTSLHEKWQAQHIHCNTSEETAKRFLAKGSSREDYLAAL